MENQYILYNQEKRGHAMIRLRVKEILAEQEHTKYWLFKQLGYSYDNMNRIVENKTTQIRFETLESLSRILNCPVGDLFEITDSDDNTSN